ncbi:MAG: G5 domain-containing protein [Clostridiales bacterium]|jgi:3D (Asp-Asp-Asp) domain-containing protein|nr:G5 domain-containing protein [Clostridiales bacterium]
MRKCFKGVLLAVVFLTVMSGAAVAASKPRDVTVTDNGVKQNYITRAETVGEFLKESGVTIGENDAVTPSLNEEIIENYVTDIKIVRGVDIELIIDGKSEKRNIPGLISVGAFIAGLEKQTDKNYKYDGDLTEIVKNDRKITLTGFTQSKIVKKEEIPFSTTFNADDSLERGKIVVEKEGEPGLKEVVAMVTKWSSGATETSVLKESSIKAPVNRVIRQGVKDAPSPVLTVKDSEMQYVKRYIMNASAYTAGYESTGKNPGDPGYGVTASGMLVKKGVVAVDPAVIPLGTKLYVEGYGYAVAADTGGSIKGEKIDLYYENLSDAIKFGRRQIEVYVLTEQ